MIKKIFVLIALWSVTGMYAQENTASPYSFYALGDVKFKGAIENRTMAGLSVYTDSIHLNLQNPASYGGLKLTTYAASVSYNNFALKTDTAKENAGTAAFNYLSLGFPISKKMGVGVGLMPYTAVGYRLESIDDSGPQSITNRFNGEGGINRLYFSLGYAITKGLSLGVTGNYNFGKLENESLVIVEDVELATRETNRSNVSGMDVNLALNYKQYFKNNAYASFLVRYTPQTKIGSENFRTLSTVEFLTTGGEITRDSEDIDLSGLNLENTDITLPSATTFEAGVGKNKKWFFGMAYEYRNMSAFSNPFVDAVNFEYEDASRFSAGGFFIPQYDSFTNYWKRVVYRAGMRYEKTGLRVNDTAVNDFGMSFVVGLPLSGFGALDVAGLFSNINVGLDIGRRGRADSGIQENYFNFNVSLSLNDRWFIKRKYN